MAWFRQTPSNTPAPSTPPTSASPIATSDFWAKFDAEHSAQWVQELEQALREASAVGAPGAAGVLAKLLRTSPSDRTEMAKTFHLAREAGTAVQLFPWYAAIRD